METIPVLWLSLPVLVTNPRILTDLSGVQMYTQYLGLGTDRFRGMRFTSDLRCSLVVRLPYSQKFVTRKDRYKNTVLGVHKKGIFKIRFQIETTNCLFLL